MPGQQKEVTPAELHNLVRDVREMRGLMSQIADAITRITLLDERQQVVSAFMQKLDERMARMEHRHQETEIANALARQGASRLTNVEASFREMHLDRERDKARFQTVVWMVRGLWAICGTGVVGIVAMQLKQGAGA